MYYLKPPAQMLADARAAAGARATTEAEFSGLAAGSIAGR